MVTAVQQAEERRMGEEIGRKLDWMRMGCSVVREIEEEERRGKGQRAGEEDELALGGDC